MGGVLKVEGARPQAEPGKESEGVGEVGLAFEACNNFPECFIYILESNHGCLNKTVMLYYSFHIQCKENNVPHFNFVELLLAVYETLAVVQLHHTRLCIIPCRILYKIQPLHLQTNACYNKSNNK